MKEKKLIKDKEPCVTPMDDPDIQTVADAEARGQVPCRFYSNRELCKQFGCVQKAGHQVAKYVLQFYAEASEENLEAELAEFRRVAPMPPDDVEAYLDTPDKDYRRLTDADAIFERVAFFARQVLDLTPGERPLRSPEDDVPPYPSE